MGYTNMRFFTAIAVCQAGYDSVDCSAYSGDNNWSSDHCSSDGQCSGDEECNQTACSTGSGASCQIQYTGGTDCKFYVNACQMDARSLLEEEEDFDSLDDLELDVSEGTRGGFNG